MSWTVLVDLGAYREIHRLESHSRTQLLLIQRRLERDGPPRARSIRGKSKIAAAARQRRGRPQCLGADTGVGARNDLDHSKRLVIREAKMVRLTEGGVDVG